MSFPSPRPSLTATISDASFSFVAEESADEIVPLSGLYLRTLIDLAKGALAELLAKDPCYAAEARPLNGRGLAHSRLIAIGCCGANIATRGPLPRDRLKVTDRMVIAILVI